MNHFVFSSFLSFIATLAAGIWFLLRPGFGHRRFAWFWLCVAFWTSFVAFQIPLIERMQPFLWGWFLHLGCIMVPVFFLHFSIDYCKCDGFWWRGTLKLSYAIAIMFLLLNATDFT